MQRIYQTVKVGEKYNRLTIIELLPGSKVRCRCDCGNEIITRRDHVKEEFRGRADVITKKLQAQSTVHTDLRTTNFIRRGTT